MTRAVWLVVIGIISVQAGAAIAKDLFGTISPTSMVFLRLVTSTLVLLAVARPSVRGRSRSDWLVVAGFGASLGLMNWAIYQSFSRIPLGIAVTIEFIGPLTLAVVGSRKARDLVWVGLAAIGVVLLGFEPADLDAVGVAFALLAGVAWASYILLSAQTGQRWPGFDGLAIASAFATLLLTAPAIVSGGTALLDPHILAIGALVGVLSSVIPYSCELVALRSLAPSVFGILMSLEPAAAALAAIVVLGELLSPIQWLAVACVVVASVGATRSRPVLSEPAPD
ncbi:MAG: EamA family transporter [Nocardioides sp.]|uniref:EamA family transporter n=1 Tax=Nocardioides sp. TaxID=35761 RepID=UPI0032666C2F